MFLGGRCKHFMPVCPSEHNTLLVLSMSCINVKVNMFLRISYTAAQNKADYLLLLSKFCISTTKHASVIMYV